VGRIKVIEIVGVILYMSIVVISINLSIILYMSIVVM